jgi:hypothetical protein
MGSEMGAGMVELARGRREAMRRSTPVYHVMLWILGTNGRRWIQPDGTASENGMGQPDGDLVTEQGRLRRRFILR